MNRGDEIGDRENKKRRIERIEIGEKLTNIVTIEDKVVEGTEITDFEIEHINWEKRIKEHQERIEKETRERMELIRKKEIKEKSWQL